MSYCEYTRNVVVFGRNKDKKTAILFNPDCKSWSCNYCAEVKKEEWIHNTGRGASILRDEGANLMFVTLTSRGYASPNKSIYFFKQNWPKLRKRITDRTNMWEDETGYRMNYLLVPERHKSGVLHAHMVIATHISSKQAWKHHAHQTGFGYIIDVQEMITPLLAAEYVSKYLHKGMGAEAWPKGFRRVRHSQKWPISRPKKDKRWEWDTYKNPNTVWLEKHALIDMGWAVIDKTEEKI